MEQFKLVIQKMISLFIALEELEQKKLEAVQKKRITLLEDVMNKEQADILKLRGLERELYAVQKQCGWEGKKFREIIEVVPQEIKEELNELFQQFTHQMQQFQTVNQEANKLIELNLYAMNKVLEKNGIEYNDNGKVQNRTRSFTNTRI